MSLLDTASLIVTPNGYKEGKLYSVIPSDGSGDLSVTRATTATRVNSAGLVELVPYNLVQYSQTFTNGVWGNAGYGNTATIVANDTIAPDGTMTASKATFTASGTQGRLVQSITTTNGAEYTASFYVKYGNKTTINFYSDAAVFGTFVTFNFTSNTITNSNNTYGSSVENVGNGWYRISFKTFAPSSTAQFGMITFGGEDGFVYLWGGQLELGATATAYQKTETRLNIPRLDYSNGTCPSLLVEPQRTNLALYSSSFDSAFWDKINVSITANATTSPSGVQDADMTTNSTLVGDRYQQLIFTPSSGFRTISIYAKAGTASIVGLQTYDNVSDAQAYFDLSNGTITSTSGGVTATITDVGDGWYRLTHTYNSPTNVVYFQIQLGSQAGTRYFWGAQLEVGSYSTSYIPTTSASVTRNADVISKTGISSLIGQTEGTILLDFVLKNPLSATNRIISLTETNWLSGGSIRLDIDYNQIKADFVNGGSNIGSIIYSTTPLQNIRYKVAIAYKENDCQMYINGVDAGSDTTTGAMPTCSELYLNALGGGFNAPYEASNINAAALWPTRLTNTQLAQLTTI